MRKWVMTQARLRDVPGGQPGSLILCEMPFGALCDPTGNETVTTFNGQATRWSEVIYSSSVRTYRGWVYAGFLEDYDPTDHPAIVPIGNPTPNPTDAAQYAVFKGQTQYNLCGELCVAYCAHVSLNDLLAEWEVKSPSLFNSVFYNGRGRTTGLYDLDSMLAAFDVETPSLRLDAALRDPILGRALITPQRVETVLQDARVIVGVKIEGYLGRLKPSGIPHWVTLENVYPHDINNGTVEIYNPFTNHMEGYSWAEFVSSMGAPLGILVRR